MLTPALLLSFVPAAAAPDEPVVAFIDVRVVAMESEAVLEGQTVVVEGDRIVAIGPKDDLDVPASAEVIAGLGAYLMPGLFDLHVHLQDDIDPELYVLNGVTTVRECGGSTSSFAQRARIEAGELLGPRLFIASAPIIGFGDDLSGRTLEGAELHAAALEVAEREKERGFEFLKIYDNITAPGYGALVRAARQVGIRPIGHVPRNLRLEVILETPPDSIAHAEEFLYSEFAPALDPSDIPDTARRVAQSGLAVVTTLVTYDHIGRQVADLAAELERGEARYASALQLRDWGPENNRHKHFEKSSATFFRSALAFQKRFLGAFHEAGVPILLGTDSGGYGIPFVFAGFSAHEELEHLVGCGLSPYEAVAAATREPARYLGVLDDVGTISPGKRADLILVWGNPLDDVKNVALRAGVMVKGRWIPVDEIHARLDRIAEQARREVDFVRAVKQRGDAGAREVLTRSLAEEPGLLPFRRRTLNELGYEALKIDGDPGLAAALFELGVELFPLSWSAHDSLGEALVALGELGAAVASYQRSLELFPGNREAADVMMELLGRLEGSNE